MNNTGVLLSVSRYLDVVYDIDFAIDDERAPWKFRSYVKLLDDATLLEYWKMYKDAVRSENNLKAIASMESLERVDEAECVELTKEGGNGLEKGDLDSINFNDISLDGVCSEDLEPVRQDFSLYEPLQPSSSVIVPAQHDLMESTTTQIIEEAEQQQTMKIRLPAVI